MSWGWKLYIGAETNGAGPASWNEGARGGSLRKSPGSSCERPLLSQPSSRLNK